MWFAGRDVGRDHMYAPGETLFIKAQQGEKLDEDAGTGEAPDTEIGVTPPLTRALSPYMLDRFT